MLGFGAVCENVAFDLESRMVFFPCPVLDFSQYFCQPLYDEVTRTKNGRVGYSLSALKNVVSSGCCAPPTSIIFLVCDSFGYFPAVCKLTHAQAVYHFLSGYTTLIPSTEVGEKEIKPGFFLFFFDTPHIIFF